MNVWICGTHPRGRSVSLKLTASAATAIALLLFALPAARAQSPNYQVSLGYSAPKGCAQAASQAKTGRIQMDELSRLAAKAQSVKSVALDQSMLQLASGVVAKGEAGAKGNTGNDQAIRQILGQLKGIYVKDFEFAKPGEYSQADVSQILCQVQGHSWEQVVSSVDKRTHETAGIYVLHDANTFKAILIVSAKPQELAVVNIVGPINPNDLSHMQGVFGIPNMNTGAGKSPAKPKGPGKP